MSTDDCVLGAVGGNNHLMEKPREKQEPGTGLVWYQDHSHCHHADDHRKPEWDEQEDLFAHSPLGVNDGIINGESLSGQ